MNQSRKLIFSSKAHALIESQCKKFCQEKKTHDMIGPVDPVSNLRPIKYAVPENESPAEQKLRKYRKELLNWNITFWTNHNINFIKQKKEFEKMELEKKPADCKFLSATEISVFYKKFLDDNWKTHLRYLFEWYRKNFYATFLHLKVNIFKLFKRL